MIYFFGILTVLSALGIVFFKHPIKCALSLMASMTFLAAIYACLGIHLIAAFQILIYVGAVMVMIIFTIMLLNMKKQDYFISYNKLVPLAIIFLLIFFSSFIPILFRNSLGIPEIFQEIGSVEYFSKFFTTRYLLQVEIASMILLSGVVALIAILKKSDSGEC